MMLKSTFISIVLPVFLIIFAYYVLPSFKVKDQIELPIDIVEDTLISSKTSLKLGEAKVKKSIKNTKISKTEKVKKTPPPPPLPSKKMIEKKNIVLNKKKEIREIAELIKKKPKPKIKKIKKTLKHKEKKKTKKIKKKKKKKITEKVKGEIDINKNVYFLFKKTSKQKIKIKKDIATHCEVLNINLF